MKKKIKIITNLSKLPNNRFKNLIENIGEVLAEMYKEQLGEFKKDYRSNKT